MTGTCHFTRVSQLLLVGGLLSCWLGCTGPSTSSSSRVESTPGDRTQTVRTDAASASDDGQLLQRLEQAGFKVSGNQRSGKRESLDGSQVDMTDELASLLGQADSVSRLVLRHARLSTTGWSQLARLAAMEHLDLRDCELDNQQLASLVAGLPRLRSLRLGGQGGHSAIDDDGLAVLAQLPQLKLLGLDYLPIRGDGLEQLPHCPRLEELYLAGTRLDDAALQPIGNCSSLRKLRLAATEIGAAGLQWLTDLPLNELDLSQCPRVDQLALEQVGQIASLQRLNLFRTSTTDRGLVHLADLPELTWLNLDATSISDAGLEHLGVLRRLTFLHLGSTAVSDRGLPQLTGLSQLQTLVVTRTAVTPAGAELIKLAIPGVSVQLEYVAGR